MEIMIPLVAIVLAALGIYMWLAHSGVKKFGASFSREKTASIVRKFFATKNRAGRIEFYSDDFTKLMQAYAESGIIILEVFRFDQYKFDVILDTSRIFSNNIIGDSVEFPDADRFADFVDTLFQTMERDGGYLRIKLSTSLT